jgi:hypothetical protein
MSPNRHSLYDRDAGYYQGIICLEIAIGKVAAAVRDRILLLTSKQAKPFVSWRAAPRGIGNYAPYIPSSAGKLCGFADVFRYL